MSYSIIKRFPMLMVVGLVVLKLEIPAQRCNFSLTIHGKRAQVSPKSHL